MKNIHGFSLIELLVTLAIAGILIGSTGGVVTRLLLNGNQIKASMAEIDLKTDICRALNHFDTCKAYLQYNQLRLRSGKVLQADYVYKKRLKIVKIEVTGPSQPDATITINVYYKKLSVSLDAQDLCTSTDTSKCEKQSYDLKYDFLDPDAEVCHPIYCGNNSESNPESAQQQVKICAPDTLNYCALESAFSGITKTGQCTGTKNRGSCSYECKDDGWHEVSNGCREPYRCLAIRKVNCNLNKTDHGLTDGRCSSGYSGTCVYRCNDGTWGKQFDDCKQNCNANGVTGCTFTNITHNSVETCSNCGSGYTGTKNYRCNDGAWEEQLNSCVLSVGP